VLIQGALLAAHLRDTGAAARPMEAQGFHGLPYDETEPDAVTDRVRAGKESRR
jgi:hypothetical protein